MIRRGLRSIHRLRKSRPGYRFQHRYYRHAGRHGTQRKLLMALAAAALIVVGVILMPIPGPGSLVAVLGLALLAGVSLKAARLLDDGEIYLRRSIHWAGEHWSRASLAMRAALVTAAVAILGMGSYATFRVLTDLMPGLSAAG